MSAPAPAYSLGDEVLILAGPGTGSVGVIDEIDEADPVDTYRVAVGNGVTWTGPKSIKPAGGAR